MPLHPSGAPLTVGVWGADKPAKAAYTAELLTALHASALNVVLSHGPGADVHFLLGINGLDKASGQDTAMHAADASLRQQLGHTGVAYAVLYGPLVSQVNKAITVIARLLAADHQASDTLAVPNFPAWVWPCDKCGDAGCEFKLLTNLLSGRQATP